MKSIAKMARRRMIERVVNFVGGAKDGTSGKIQCPDKHYVLPVLYYAKPLSLEESAALDIDGVIKYRGPDEAYRLEGSKGEWRKFVKEA